MREAISVQGAAEMMPYANVTAETDAKQLLVGTHRVCPPEETFARVQPFLGRMGITRVSELTWLDDLGIPVYQAIHPNLRNHSLSQGKGITRQLAKVSAVMEGIESWHAENPMLPTRRATVGEMAPLLPYSLYDLNLSPHALLHDRLALDWFPARVSGSGQETFVPADYIRLDFTARDSWFLPTFFVTSNGLASGNTQQEAILHALYEVIERDSLALARTGVVRRTPIDLDTIDGTASSYVLERLRKAGATVEVFDVTGPTGISCLEARLISPSYPIFAGGSGCHLDRDVALSRALTEAAQSRLTMIAGARDDLHIRFYKTIRSRRALPRFEKKLPLAHFREVASAHSSHLTADLREVTRRVLSVLPAGACPPLIVDLTRPEFNIPVVYVVVPQFRFSEAH